MYNPCSTAASGQFNAPLPFAQARLAHGEMGWGILPIGCNTVILPDYNTSTTGQPNQQPLAAGGGNEATKGDPPPTGDPASAHAWRAPRSGTAARARRQHKHPPPERLWPRRGPHAGERSPLSTHRLVRGLICGHPSLSFWHAACRPMQVFLFNMAFPLPMCTHTHTHTPLTWGIQELTWNWNNSNWLQYFQ